MFSGGPPAPPLADDYASRQAAAHGAPRPHSCLVGCDDVAFGERVAADLEDPRSRSSMLLVGVPQLVTVFARHTMRHPPVQAFRAALVAVLELVPCW